MVRAQTREFRKSGYRIFCKMFFDMSGDSLPLTYSEAARNDSRAVRIRMHEFVGEYDPPFSTLTPLTLPWRGTVAQSSPRALAVATA
jgi:hypothetical protein